MFKKGKSGPHPVQDAPGAGGQGFCGKALNDMKIAIVGAGALGCLFGGKMAAQGQDVYFYDAWPAQVEALRTGGITVRDPNRELKTPPVRATGSFDDLRDRDLYFVFVKSYDNARILPALKEIAGPHSRVITMQNGLGNAEFASEFFAPERILIGVTFQGGTLIEPGVMEHRAFGATNIANFSGRPDAFLAQVEELLREAGFDTKAHDNVDSIIWSKLVQNAAYNALTGITRLRMGRIVCGPGRRIAEMVIEEIAAIADRKKIPLSYADPVADTMKLIEDKMPEVVSSLLSDILKQRPTEIDTLNGAVVQEGKKLGIPVPANELITNLVKLIEQNYDNMLWTL